MTAEPAVAGARPGTAPLAPGDRLGILGGGQLGRMLAMAAGRLGLETWILDPDPAAPAAQFANRHIVAAFDDMGALTELASACRVVTYEFENIPVESARHVENLGERSGVLHPSSHALETSQDRQVEKTFLQQAGLQTAPFMPVSSLRELEAAHAAMGGGTILKTRRFGYDGKGQVRLPPGADAAQLQSAWSAVAQAPCVLEGLIPFSLEISVIAARALDGSSVSYDPACNVHRNGILATSTLPAPIPAALAEQARAAAVSILEALDYVGVIGVEFFVTEKGELLVNEFAPRVHNSGHWTEAACAVSQFEQHIRAVCGWPLASATRHSDCVMENLIGSDVGRFSSLTGQAGTLIHLYGKQEVREGRKMGHYTRLTGPAS